MPILPIKYHPDPVLREVALEVVDFDAALSSFLDSMFDTMYAARGVGLASNQVGVLKRAIVIDVSEGRSDPLELINPVIIEQSGTVPSEEGCLSIPEYRDTIKRSEVVSVEAVDRSGKQFNIEADGLLAICLQHEIDHLNGILFIDHLSRLKRELFKRWLKRQSL